MWTRTIPDETRRRILDLAAQGHSRRTIAVMVRVAKSTVSKIVTDRRLGRPRKPRADSYAAVREAVKRAMRSRMALIQAGLEQPIDDMDEDDYRPRLREWPE